MMGFPTNPYDNENFMDDEEGGRTPQDDVKEKLRRAVKKGGKGVQDIGGAHLLDLENLPEGLTVEDVFAHTIKQCSDMLTDFATPVDAQSLIKVISGLAHSKDKVADLTPFINKYLKSVEHKHSRPAPHLEDQMVGRGLVMALAGMSALYAIVTTECMGYEFVLRKKKG